MKRLLSITAIAITTLVATLPVFAQDGATENTPEVTPEATAEITTEPELSCFVFTDEARTIRVRVGPGENRTSVTFLPAEEEIPVLGETEDDDGNLWYRLDKELAAPGRAINEAWISVENDDLETIGDCDDVGDATAPPIIPIRTQAAPSGDEDESGDEEMAVVDGALPVDGTWRVNWYSTMDVSCAGTGNVVVPTNEIFGPPGASLLPSSTSLFNITRPNAEAPFMFMFTPMYVQGNGAYRGEITFFDTDGSFLPAVITIQSISNPTHMSGYIVVNADDCSGTVSFTATV